MYLSDFAIESPPHEFEQEAFLRWLKERHPNFIDNIQRVCCKENKISKRRFVISELRYLDYGEKSALFDAYAEKVFETLYLSKNSPPEEIIHVTCTGYRSPSAAQVLATRRGWEAVTKVTHAYHMGCLAALSAIRIGAGYASLGSKEIDIVHTELCSLHLNPSLTTSEQFVAQSLFADGTIKYTLTSDCKGPGFRILAQLERMIPDTEELMKWETASWGLKMTLSREIPLRIVRVVAPFVEELAKGRPLEDLIFAIHPGGPKIIELIENKLKLSKKQVAATEKILYGRGNMSSATLPHIWEEILHNAEYPSGSLILGLAFGPGLTISGNLLEKIA
ncbi:MAG: hypothetical protein JJU12_06560 [Chlamydiales bacterium]|nr:hypothetical protein [Chlamydiales bacterium]